MNPETKTCQNCKNDFVIETEDFAFYNKIKVPPPTFCSECRFIRRLSFLNWMTLYKRKCDSCHTDTVSVHNEDTPFKNFCNPCWWADNWDGTEYGMDYDPSRNFFEQLIELKNKSVFMGLENLHTSLVDTPYANATAYQKDCFMVFNADYGERNAYAVFTAHLTESMDCFIMRNSELCYECVAINKSYRCFYSEELKSCSDMYFSRNCSDCNNCFGCINLKKKSNCIFNVQYSPEDYKEKIKEFGIDTIYGVEKMRHIVQNFWLQNPEQATKGNSMNVNTTGDRVTESKNAKDCFLATNVEDSKYVQLITLPSVKDSYDYTIWGYGAEKLYECLTVGEGAYNSHFCVQCWPASVDNEYCMYAISSKDCFGCVNIKKKRYCILNKEYSKDDYEILKAKIIADMKANPYVDKTGKVWSYGELFPPEMSPYSYNETMANQFYPKEKGEVVANGGYWYESKENNYTPTINSSDLPQSASDVDESILKEVVSCGNCSQSYKINERELYLLKKLELPLPIWCWKCRHKRRFDRVNKPKLYDRSCMKCDKNIKTSYAPDRPEIVYCRECYQQEVS